METIATIKGWENAEDSNYPLRDIERCVTLKLEGSEALLMAILKHLQGFEFKDRPIVIE